MGFFSSIKKFFGQEPKKTPTPKAEIPDVISEIEKNAPDEKQEDALYAGAKKGDDVSPGAIDEVSEVADTEKTSKDESSISEIASEEKATGALSKETPLQDDGQKSHKEDLQEAQNPDELSQKNAETPSSGPETPNEAAEPENQELLVRLRSADPKLSIWLDIVLENVTVADDLFWKRLRFLLEALEAPQTEAENFIKDFRNWLERMEYWHLDEFRSELQYRLALALDLEDEEDERNRLLLKLSAGLAKTRENLGRQLDNIFASHGELDDRFWNELEELFIMADLGYDASMEIVARLKERARKGKIKESSEVKELLRQEIEEIFRTDAKIKAVNKPEVILMAGVNGAGKTTTIAKLAHRMRMQGKKVLIVAADTFRAAAIEQLQVWANRANALFYAKNQGADPAAVAWEGMDMALKENVDVVFIDTAGRLQTKTNLMEELGKIRQVLSKKHPGSPHRSILVLDATTGQNALSQAKLFREAAGIDELILTKIDGTAKGGVALAVAMQEKLPISFIGLGEKMEDLRPFNGEDFAAALLQDNSGYGSSEKMD